MEKLSLIHDDNLEARPVVESEVIEVAYRDTRSPLSIVRRNLVATVAGVLRMLDDENRGLKSCIP
jgi:hypothetical protein